MTRATEASPDFAEPVVVGVDCTPTTLRLVMGTVEGEVIHQEEHPLPPLDDEAAWSWEVGGRISAMFAAEGAKRWALGIAVACPGSVDPAAGRLEESLLAPDWEGLNVVTALRQHIDTPIVALNRVEAALRGEAWAGSASGTFDALYVSLDDGPAAAVLTSGRVVGGANHRAGGLPAFPELQPGQPLTGDDLEQAAALLADIAVLLDPAVVVIHGAMEHTGPLLPVLQRVLDQVLPGAQVAPAHFGDRAAVLGAMRAASTVAYEGLRNDDES